MGPRDDALPGEPPPLGGLAAAAERHEATELVREFAASLTDPQRAIVALGYDHADPERGRVRTFVANHWQVTPPAVRSDFYSPSQQALIHAIFRAMLSADGYARRLRQLVDDCLGHPWGTNQSVALLGDPVAGPFQFLFTGRHVTLRHDGGSEPGVAFGGPVFYAHTVDFYIERPGHPRNVYWHEAVAASRWLDALPAELARRALVRSIPPEPPPGFRPDPPGLALVDVPDDAFAGAGALLASLHAHFPPAEVARLERCLAAQGGLRACTIAFARDGRMSAPLFDDWRLEGPSFVWHWRGYPHVHVWVHAAASAEAPVNARSGQFLCTGQDRLPQPMLPFEV